MFRKSVWLPILIAGLFVMGCGLFYGRKVAHQAPIKTYKPVEVETQPKPPPPGETYETGHWHGDEWHAEPHETHAPAPPQQENDVVAEPAPPPPEKVESSETLRQPLPPEPDPDFVNPTSQSSNPLFADGVPEHLQCPPELIGVYVKEVSSETVQQLQQRGVEIIENWNPNRPLPEVYPAFIEAEKWYHSNADPARAGRGWGANQLDWQFKIVLDYPEIAVLAQEDTGRSMAMWRVELGDWSPDFNQFTIPDGSGRTFRKDYDKQYVFTWSNYTETADGFESNTFQHKTSISPESDVTEVVHINLDTISDEELEALSGWNYNINPYTTGAYQLGDHR